MCLVSENKTISSEDELTGNRKSVWEEADICKLTHILKERVETAEDTKHMPKSRVTWQTWTGVPRGVDTQLESSMAKTLEMLQNNVKDSHMPVNYKQTS